MDQFLAFLNGVVDAAGPQVVTLLALIAANVIAGVGLAIKNKQFEFSKLANFFASDVIPKLFGYLAVRIVVELGAVEFLGPDIANAVAQGIITTAWVAVVGSVGGDLLNKLASLGISVLGRVPGIEA